MTTIRHLAALALLSAFLALPACGGSTVQAGPVYAGAVRAARAFCAVVAVLPEPTPAATSGGEATP
jgi:hypothetical protein